MKTIAQQLKVKQFPFIIRDENGNKIYYEYSDSFWVKREFDENSNEIYYEDSDDLIKDDRPKPIQEYTMEELTKIVGKKFKIVK